MKPRITIFHTKPPSLILPSSGGRFAIVWRKPPEGAFKNLSYFTPQEVGSSRSKILATRPRPYVFFSTTPGEWYFRRFAEYGTHGDYFWMVQYLGGVFYFHSNHYAFNFTELVSGHGPTQLDHPHYNK